MNFQAVLLVGIILLAVAAFVLLPGLYGANARRRRRKKVAFGERHQSVDLFKSNQEQEPPAPDA